MDILHQFLSLFTPEGIDHLIRVGGLATVCVIIFAETGFFALLPGDSLLVLSGILAAGPNPPIQLWQLLCILPFCAMAGDQSGYWMGTWFGRKMYGWPDRKLAGFPVFKQAWLKRTHEFTERWGRFALVAGRWVPIVRTFVPIVSGIGGMAYATFTLFIVIGGTTWIFGTVLLGYCLGSFAESHGFPLQRHIDKVAIVVVALSLMPILVTYLRERGKKKPAPGKAKALAAKPQRRSQGKKGIG